MLWGTYGALQILQSQITNQGLNQMQGSKVMWMEILFGGHFKLGEESKEE